MRLIAAVAGIACLGPLPAIAQPGNGSLAGTFAIGQPLPEKAPLEVVLLKAGAEVARLPVSAGGDAVAFRFDGLGAGAYTVRLVATREGKPLVLGATPATELSAAAPAKDGVRAKAVAIDGRISGTVKLTGAPPPKRMIFVSARRVDMAHTSYMPDGANNASQELAPEELAAGEVKYAFEGLSCGVYRLALMSYDYATHQTQAHGTLAEEIVLDLDRARHADKSFDASFAAR